MSRDARREQLARILAPRLLPDEEIVANGAAWFAAVGREARRLFVGRHYRLVALTDRRLLVFPRRGRRRGALLDAPLETLRVDHVGGAGVLFRVRIATGDGTVAILEFRPRERAMGRAVVDDIRRAAPATRS